MPKKQLDTRRYRTPTVRGLISSIMPKMPGGSSGFTYRTGRRPGVTGGVKDVFPEPPADFLGTRPEWAIFWAHGVLKRKEGEDFMYLSHIAGIQVDFEEFDLGIALNIQGLYWHYFFKGSKAYEDLMTRAFIEATGIQLVNIDEDHALADPVYYLREALAGRDHSLQARGVV